MTSPSTKRLVLVVENDKTLANRIKRRLEHEAELTVRFARAAYEALWATVDQRPDLVVLDPELPDLAGTEVCRILRSRASTADVPILVLAPKAARASQIAAAGADDYITKPFTMEDLHARIRFALRRQPEPQQGRLNSYQGAHLRATFGDGFVTVDGRRIDLARREFDLLWYLVEHRNEVVSRERLVHAVWGDADVATDSRTVATHVARLRAKLGSAGKQIRTFVRKGYIFTEDTEVQSRGA
jgi:DNA-binding response OmpR family regulator